MTGEYFRFSIDEHLWLWQGKNTCFPVLSFHLQVGSGENFIFQQLKFVNLIALEN